MSKPIKLSVEEMAYLEQRLGRAHARQRLGVEKDHESQVFGYGRNFFHFENSRMFKLLVEASLRLSGFYWIGKKNAAKVELRENEVRSARIPAEFDGYRILHLTDLHVDMSGPAMARAGELIEAVEYDICVLTGDYRGQTFGPVDDAIGGLADLLSAVKSPIYGVLGNHDSIRMLPGLERIGVRVLLNETEQLQKADARIHMAGIDDAHFYRADNLEKVATLAHPEEFSVLLSHTPEIYRQAAHAEFDLMLAGHTHGGQICLPGGFPITLDAELPRRFGSGAWRHHDLQGYTSVGAGTSIVPVRFNCRPEITLHRLCREQGQ